MSNMINAPLVSVIMPLYNKQDYVRRAIDSVLHQSFGNWELIIVDDGSTDDSVSMIPDGDRRIRLLSRPNRGPAAARNAGLSEAAGDLITFLDADDYYCPGKLEKEARLLGQGQAEWMLSPHMRIEGDQSRMQFVRDFRGLEITSGPTLFGDTLRELSLSDVHINCLCMRRELSQAIGGFNEEMRCFEISEFMVRCALNQPQVIVSAEPHSCVVDVPHSAFKISANRLEGSRLKGESLYRLSGIHPSYAGLLRSKSRKAMLEYAALQARKGNSAEARRFLEDIYPYHHDGRWWKIWFGTHMPRPVLEHLTGALK